jgi:hypothetical protein
MPRRPLLLLLPIAALVVGAIAAVPGVGPAKTAGADAPTTASTTVRRPATTDAAAAPQRLDVAPTAELSGAPSTAPTSAPTAPTAPAPASASGQGRNAALASASTPDGVVEPATASSAASTAAPAASPSAVPAPSAPRYARSATEGFAPGWFRTWGFAQPRHTGVVAEADGNTFLRSTIVAGTHDGTSFRLPMPEADVAHLRYRVRYGSAFSPTGSATNVKMPGFGSPSLDVAGVCLSGCGLAVADGITAYSARSDIRQDGVPGWYVYDVESANSATFGRGERWTFPGFANDRWYTVDQYIRMNTPGQKDGSLRTLIDGQPVFERTSYDFRTVPTLRVGSAWFDVYFGGSGLAPVDMDVDFDDVLLEWG